MVVHAMQCNVNTHQLPNALSPLPGPRRHLATCGLSSDGMVLLVIDLTWSRERTLERTQERTPGNLWGLLRWNGFACLWRDVSVSDQCFEWTLYIDPRLHTWWCHWGPSLGIVLLGNLLLIQVGLSFQICQIRIDMSIQRYESEVLE